MSEKKTIITIGRQYGSAGREIGATLAQDLGFKMYDKEMVKELLKTAECARSYLKHMMKNQLTVSSILW